MNRLIYSGCFTTTSKTDKLIYCCDKYSRIYFFNEFGIFTKELITEDKTPLPKLLKNSNGDYFYSRGATWTTNMGGCFIKQDKIFVFSSRSDEKNKIIIDQYSFKTAKYEQSFKLNFNNLNSNSINSVFIDDNKIILGFDFYYASFIF